jgi:type I restriction enzyme S subunit
MANEAPYRHDGAWPLATLGNVTTKIGSGATPKGGAETYLPARQTFAFVRSQNVFDRRFDGSALVFITDEQAKGLRGVVLQPGDVLLNITGDGVTFGRAALVDESALPACVNQHVSIVRADPEKADPGYLLAYLTHPDVKPYIASFNSGGSRRAVTKGNIESFRVPLPPIETQRAIAATLGALDDKIDSNRRLIALAEGLARAHFSRLFQIDDLDTGLPLSTLFSINPRRILPAGRASTYVGMASLPEFSAEVYEWEQKPAGSGQRFTNGDVLMARITPCLENGKTAIVDMLQPGEVGWGSTEYVVLAPKADVTTAWIYCLVRDDRVRDFAIRSMSGTSGRQRFQADRLDQYRIIPPTSEALNEFSNIATPLFTRMTQMRDEVKTLSTLRDALIPELLSGRVRVPIEDLA